MRDEDDAPNSSGSSRVGARARAGMLIVALGGRLWPMVTCLFDPVPEEEPVLGWNTAS